MARSGTETRKKTKVIGVRVDDDFDALLRDRAARAGLGHCEYARRILQQQIAGAEPVNRVARNRLVVDVQDRNILGEVSRSAGMLAGALIQTAKAARTQGRLTAYHAAVEQLLADLKEVKLSVDAIREKIQ